MSTLEEVTWNLDDLLEDGTESDPEAAVVALLDEADKAAGKFSADYEGKVAEISGQDLIVAMTRLADISDRAGRALNYAHLRFAARRTRYVEVVAERAQAGRVHEGGHRDLSQLDGCLFTRHHRRHRAVGRNAPAAPGGMVMGGSRGRPSLVTMRPSPSVRSSPERV